METIDSIKIAVYMSSSENVCLQLVQVPYDEFCKLNPNIYGYPTVFCLHEKCLLWPKLESEKVLKQLFVDIVDD